MKANEIANALLNPGVDKPPGHYLCTPEPGRLRCVISTPKGVNGVMSQSVIK